MKMSFVIGPRISHFVLSYVYGAPKTAGAQVLGKQVLRSATSIEANYPGSNRVRSKAEFITKWGDFLRAIEETALAGIDRRCGNCRRREAYASSARMEPAGSGAT